MQRTNKCKKVGFSMFLWGVIAILVCFIPCSADEIPPEGSLDLYGTHTNTILDVYGTLNMYSQAYVPSIVAHPGTEEVGHGGIVNVYGCAAGNILFVNPASDTYPCAPVVTVYGSKFRVGGTIYTPPYDIYLPYQLLEILSEDETDPQVLFSLTIFSGGTLIHLRAPVITVDIDIKPGSDPNPINPGSNGLIPVAILTTSEFDAVDVDPGTVTLAGAEVAVRGKSDKLMARLEDVDGDGDLDLMLQVDTQSYGAVWEEGPVTLEGTTYEELGAEAIQGIDNVVIVPPE